MRYRRLTDTGDYVFGQGSLDYLSDADAAAQAVQTKLKLLLGEWWEDTQDGLPLFQQILLQRATAEGIQTVDLLIKQRILEVAEVTNVQIIRSGVKDRQYQADVVIETIYGDIKDTIRLEVG